MTTQTEIKTTDLYADARQKSVFWLTELPGILELKGPEAGSYLQTQLTQDVLQLPSGQAIAAALVERKAHLRALMQVYRLDSALYWLIPEAGFETLAQHLEQFHFVEDFEMTTLSDYQLLQLEGPQSLEVLQHVLQSEFLALKDRQIQTISFAGETVYVRLASLSGEPGFALLAKTELQARLKAQLVQAGVPELDPATYEVLRIESGIPRFGVDMDSESLLPETGLEKSTVSYDKGCYLGQEVIARIHSYGVPPKALIGLECEQEPAGVGELFYEGKSVGKLSSFAYSPRLKRWLALANLHKSLRQNDLKVELDLNGQTLPASVRRLPFYAPISLTDQAETLLNQALDVFANGDETRAIPLLQAAIQRNPHLADAYESLGVILSRQGLHHEAIAVMKQLAEVAPEEPMAQTNLSRFYMLLGDKSTAEQHMAEATRLNMLRNQREFQAQQVLNQQKEQERQQKLDLMEMFREVLESEDPDDLIANFGLGKALVDLERFGEAIPYLQKATRIDPLYSAAWLQLGKAHEANQDLQRAFEVYSKGMDAAAEKGDLMPLKEMEQRRAGLKL